MYLQRVPKIYSGQLTVLYALNLRGVLLMFSYERHLVVVLVLAVLIVIAAVVAAFFGVSVPFIGD
jgi:hypothetical protein